VRRDNLKESKSRSLPERPIVALENIKNLGKNYGDFCELREIVEPFADRCRRIHVYVSSAFQTSDPWLNCWLQGAH
jgi:hypothetical protein